jgi:hypothetical protein
VCDLWLQIGCWLHRRILRIHPLGILITPLPAVESKQDTRQRLRCGSGLLIDPALFGGGADAFGKILKIADLLRGKRSNNLVKARVSAQLIPFGVEAQLAIAQKAWKFRCLLQALKRAILIAGPCMDEREVFD